MAGLLGKFGLGHDGFGMASLVGNLDHEGRSVLSTNEAWHQADAAASFQVHVSDVSSADKLVVHEHPRALGLACLLGNFVLCHLDSGVSRSVCNFYVKLRFVFHGIHLFGSMNL